MADYRAQFANPYKAAELGYIDAVIRPEDLRRRLVDTFDVLGNKRQSLPPEKAWEHSVMTSPIKKVLVANRGEIALRVMRTCRELQLETVAVFSDLIGALHVRYADEAIALASTSAESYLVIDKILEAAQRTGADAVHPGYGFLSENPEFARRLETAGITLIGPRPEAMEAMGYKTKARDVMIAAQVPVVPGSDGPVAGPDEAVIEAQRIGFPIMVKAAAGGGGKGMRRVDDPSCFTAPLRQPRVKHATALVMTECTSSVSSTGRVTSRFRFWSIRMATACIAA